MLLALDIGNSSVKGGLFSGRDIISRFSVPSRFEGGREKLRNAIRAFLNEQGITGLLDGVIISSVVPELTDLFFIVCREVTQQEPLILTVSLQTGLHYDVENPGEIGCDRIANSVAAVELFGDPAAAADLGTATTISLIKDRRFKGGVILPGLNLMAESLRRGTAQLPLVDLSSVTAPVSPLGNSTYTNIVSGIIYGTMGAIERIIMALEETEKCSISLVITGGYASLLTPVFTRKHFYDPDLTLQGLRIIAERNL